MPLSPESDISNDKKDEEIGRPGKRRKISAKGECLMKKPYFFSYLLRIW